MPDLRHLFRALRHRNFRRLFAGQTVSMVGTWLQQVAMGWLVYRLTGSALLLGVVAFCANVGILLFGTFAGVVADRVDRKLVEAGVMSASEATKAPVAKPAAKKKAPPKKRSPPLSQAKPSRKR